MKLLERMDRLVRPIAIPNLTEVLVTGQAIMWLATMFEPPLAERATLVWSKVFEGELWRLVTFLFFPPAAGPIFVLFYFYLFFMMGKALEQYWGTVRYNTYFYLGALLTLLAGLIVPADPVTGAFFQATVFLAFATHNPNFELLIFFLLPVKIKWFALIQVFGYVLILNFSPLPQKVMVIASLGNYLIFFGPTLFQSLKNLRRRTKFAAQQMELRDRARAPRHTCAICGIDNLTHPQEDFRYCSGCDGELAYCEQHLRNHQHVTSSVDSR